MVEVEWREFRILRFHEVDAAVGYDAFDGGFLLLGTVVTQSGEEIDGVIRWDADEAWSWEMLNGSCGRRGLHHRVRQREPDRAGGSVRGRVGVGAVG